MTIEIEPRPTVLGDLPFALISDVARKTTGVRCLWLQCVPGGYRRARRARRRHPFCKYGNPLHRTVFKISNSSAVGTPFDDVLSHEGELTFGRSHGLTRG